MPLDETATVTTIAMANFARLGSDKACERNNSKARFSSIESSRSFPERARCSKSGLPAVNPCNQHVASVRLSRKIAPTSPASASDEREHLQTSLALALAVCH